MSHHVRLFVSAPSALRPFLELSPAARLYTLTPDTDVAVLPYDEAVQDALHRRFGTGDWPEHQKLMLSTADQTFAAECSATAPLAYLETNYFGGIGMQSSAVWQLGRAAIAPTTMNSAAQGGQRPPTLWPINVALRALGVRASPAGDEFTAFGLVDFRSNEAIHARAWPLRV